MHLPHPPWHGALTDFSPPCSGTHPLCSYTTPDPMGICGKLPPSFADAGTDAGLFRCGLWDGGEPGQKYPNNLVMCAP